MERPSLVRLEGMAMAFVGTLQGALSFVIKRTWIRRELSSEPPSISIATSANWKSKNWSKKRIEQNPELQRGWEARVYRQDATKYGVRSKTLLSKPRGFSLYVFNFKKRKLRLGRHRFNFYLHLLGLKKFISINF